MAKSKKKKKTSKSKRSKKKTIKLSTIIKNTLIYFLIIAVGFFIHFNVISFMTIRNNFMIPALEKGTAVPVCKICYGIINPFNNENTGIFFKSPSRGDIIVFKSKEDDRLIVMRVLGVPGDTVSYVNRTILVNSKIPRQDYHRNRDFRHLHKFKLNKDMYFVCGDNKAEDSYGGNFEIVFKYQILGKVLK